MHWIKQLWAGNGAGLLNKSDRNAASAPNGVAGWLLARLRSQKRSRQRLELLERISLAPHQSLVLIEADGQRLLVATSAESAPAFFPLDSGARAAESGFCSALMDETERNSAHCAGASW